MAELKPRKTLFNPELKRRGIYVLPNLFTTAALFAGFFAIVQAMQGDFERAAMAIFICLGIVAYIILTLLVNRQTPANPDTHYTGTNGVSVYYDSSIWKVCQMTEDSTLGTVLELATADSADGAEDYQAVLLQRGTADTYPDFIDDSEKDLKQAYGIIKPRTANITVEGAEVTAVRCDIQTYYAVLATITYDSGDVVYVSALTKLASINDIVNLVESVSLS